MTARSATRHTERVVEAARVLVVATALAISACGPRAGDATSPESSARLGEAPATPARSAAPKPPCAPEDLHPGAPLERRFQSDQPCVYRVRLEAGQYARVLAEQRGVDVALRWRAPDARVLLDVDVAEGALGVEEVAVVAGTSGVHTLAVAPAGAWGAGTYGLRLEDVTTATPAARQRAEAVALLAAAEAQRKAQIDGSLPRAVALFPRALAQWRELRASAEIAITLRLWGRALAAQNQLQPAFDRFQEALSLERERGAAREQAHVLNDMVPVAHRLELASLAEASARQALALARSTSDRFAEATALGNLGAVAFRVGDAEDALTQHQAEQGLWRVLGARRQEAEAIHCQGRAYTVLGRLDDARDLFKQALPLREEVHDVAGRAATLLQQGWLEYLEGRYQAAIDLYDGAIGAVQAAGLIGELPGLFDRRGSALLHLGRHEEALAAYGAAFRKLEQAGDHRGRARVLSNIAFVHAEKREWAVALREYDQALRGLREAKDYDVLPSVLRDRARMLRDSGDFTAAQRDADEALALLERLRSSVFGAVSRAAYLDGRHQLFDFCIDLLMRRDAADARPGHAYARQAFEKAEASRGRALLDDLTWGARAHTLDTRARDEDRDFQTRLDEAVARQRRPGETGDSAEPDPAAAEVSALLREQESRRQRRRAAAAQASALAPARTLTLDEIRQQVLDDNTLLLAYSLGKERSFVWLVSRTAPLEVHELPKQEIIEDLARKVYGLMHRSQAPRLRQQGMRAAADLANVLLGRLQGKLGHQRLLVMCDGALHYVPFAALPVLPETPGEAFGDPWPAGRVPLVAEHELVYAPSASVVAQVRRERRGRRPPTRLVAVFGDPVFGLDDVRAGGAPAATPGAGAPDDAGGDLERSASDFGLDPRHLPRLRGTRAEADHILSLVPAGQSLRAVGFDATREAVVSGALRDYKILHFGTHALVNARHPQLSGLVLSLLNSDRTQRNGFLSVDDVHGLDLPADLVVLSACSTALGRESRGEGLIGLTQAFLHAGAARVAVSLWNVDDRATSAFMAHFYDALIKRSTHAPAALREAQLAMLHSDAFSAPSYWAAFTLQGDSLDNCSER